MLLGIDIGTTHCKAGVFDLRGNVVQIATRLTPAQSTPDGRTVYDPELLWQTAAETIREVANTDIRAIGVTSMAETGALFDRSTGQAYSPFLPWFDTAASPQADYLKTAFNQEQRFSQTGIRPSFKCGVAKLLWLRDHGVQTFDGRIWLGAADYIVYRLTGTFVTDHSLATRTYAYDSSRRRWDTGWLAELGFPAGLFPPVLQGGSPAGEVRENDCDLPVGIPAAVTGHDHVCAAVAVGAVTPGIVFDSMGTAESLVGTLESLDLGADARSSGLSYGCHVAPDRYYWMGGISASGGSVEWLRKILNDPPLTYDQMMTLIESVGSQPTGILYYPYLSGVSISRPDSTVRASFIGLRAEHVRGHILRAALEGVTYELETMRRAAEKISAQPIQTIITVGGSTRNRAWMQIKADVTGCQFRIFHLPDATLLGAALTAGKGAGIIEDIQSAVSDDAFETITPDPHRHQRYQGIYEGGYLRLQEALKDTLWNRDFT